MITELFGRHLRKIIETLLGGFDDVQYESFT